MELGLVGSGVGVEVGCCGVGWFGRGGWDGVWWDVGWEELTDGTCAMLGTSVSLK